MAGQDFVFNVAKGRVAYYVSLITGSTDPPITAVGGTAALVAVLLQATGLEADETLKDHVNLSTLLAGTSDELPTSGPGVTNYSRLVLPSLASAIDHTSGANWLSADSDNLVWTNLGTVGGAVATVGPNCTIGKLLICYRPATGSANTAIVPLTAHSFDVSATDGTTLTATVNNFYRAL